MTDAVVSAAAERVIALIEEQARHHINLVRGAEEMVRSLAADLHNIRNVLDDAENRRFNDNKINYWLSRLELTAYQMEDVLDEWDYALLKFQIQEGRSKALVAPPKQKVCSFMPSSWCLCFKKVAVRHDIGNKILGVKQQLDEVLKERDHYGFVVSRPAVDPPASWRDQTTSMIDLAKVHGRDADRDLLVAKLVENDGGRILSIVGTGGLGKTTLAQMVYNDSRVEESFRLRIWVCVSDPFDLAAIAKGILESIKVGSSPSTNHLDVLFKQVKESISGKKFFLVLDDVWTEDYDKWEPLENILRCGGVGSKVLVTSRSERVVKMMGARESEICRPGLLSDEDCWLLLSRLALPEGNCVEFEDIGRKIAKKCKGLPLAAKTLGSLLRFKSSLEQWSNVLNSGIWQMEEAEIDIFPHLLLSYNALSPALKRCFSYCAIFPKDSKIDVESLIQNWIALGYLGSDAGDLELKGREYFDVLAMRSLFQDFEKKGDSKSVQFCKMHDIVHDFSLFLKKKGRVEEKHSKTCLVCDPSHVSMVNEFCTLDCFTEPYPKHCDCCLRRLRILIITGGESVSYLTENLIHLRRLTLKYTAYKLSPRDLKVICKLYHLQNLTLCSCGIEEVPKEIGNLVLLRLLDLSRNELLKELPMEIGNLHLLRLLDLNGNKSLSELPENICNLQELQTLNNVGCDSLGRIPETLVGALQEFPAGIGGCKMELFRSLKNLISGTLRLKMRLGGDGDLTEVVEDARKAGLRNEMHVKNFELCFKDGDQEVPSSLWLDLIDALQPHPNLSTWDIWYYGGSKLPRWMVSPLNQLTSLSLLDCKHLTSLPAFGRLPCLVEVGFYRIEALEVVGREFLGITEGEREGEGDVIAFPKLKKLTLWGCDKLKEWEDITVEEEEAFSIMMPCLTRLVVGHCPGLRMLPHRLLRKALSLKTLDIRRSTELIERYADKDGSDWKSISINCPALHLITTYLDDHIWDS